MARFDAVILGAGGAGLMCAIRAARRGLSVALIDHAAKAGGKIIISGGGRCNFTNRSVTAENFVSGNAHFMKSALSRFTPADFIEMVEAHGIAYHERKHGQLFCDVTAKSIVEMLEGDARAAGAQFFLQHRILGVKKDGDHYSVATDHGDFEARSVVVATGGLSFPKFGATGVGFDIAREFGLKTTPLAPALDGFVFSPEDRRDLEGFSGIAIDAVMTTNGISFQENLLFTHVGFSGPVALQASLHWKPGDNVVVDFLPEISRDGLTEWFAGRRGGRAELKNQMSVFMPKRLAERFCDLYLPETLDLGNFSKKATEDFVGRLKSWTFVPAGTVGYAKAEVTRGGVDTRELSSKTMESVKHPGLYFIGEVVDVTGWLGGFNYQWAWSSGAAAGDSLAQ